MHDWRETEALFRYGLVRDAARDEISLAARGSLVRELVAGCHEHPSGETRVLSRSSIDRWVRAYRRGGFEALKPAQRANVPRTSPELLVAAADLRREQPLRTAAQIARMLAAVHGPDVAPAARTVSRHLARAGLQRQVLLGEPGAFGRFEAERPNDVWISDALHGPQLTGVPGANKAILFAILDDHSRLITAARFVRAETTIGFDGVLRTALEQRGIPSRLYVDNGGPYAAGQLARVCAVLGVRLVHSRPGRPQGRGKIERFFRTLRSQFLVELAGRPVVGLGELNRLLAAWIEQVYHRAEHSETEQTPLARYTASDPPRYPDDALLREAFLWSQKRQVTKTATVALLGNTYEVDAVLAGRSVQLLYDPFNLERIEVRWQERSYGLAVAHHVARHVHPRATRELPPSPAASTGIDYLGLIAEQHERALRNRIAYRDIPTPPQGESS